MKYFYDNYYGCDWWPFLVLKNILRPKRFLIRLWYGNVWQQSDDATPFSRDGIQIWPGLFAEFAEVINRYYPLYDRADNRYQGYGYLLYPNQGYGYLHVGKEIINHPLFLYILRRYYGHQPYAREPFHHSIAIPTEDMKSTRCMNAAIEPFNVGWHYDTPNLVQLVILLNDVTEKDSHMQYARGEHRRLRVNLTKWDYYYSDEYAKQHFDIIKCIGPKGTAFLFDTNAPHRFYMVKNSMRAMLKVGYTPGNNILSVEHDV